MMGATQRRTLALALALLLAALVGGVGALSFHRKVQEFQPLGLTARAMDGSWLVTAVSRATGPLAAGDQIVLVNGQQFAPGLDLAQLLRAKASSELWVLRDGEPRVVQYELPPLAIDLPYLLLALIGLGYLLIGFYTLLRDPRGPARVFYLWCLTSAALYLVAQTSTSDVVGRGLYLVDELARLLLGPLTLHLFLVFPRREGIHHRGRALLPFLYLPAAVLASLQLDLVLSGGRFLFGPPSESSISTLDRLELIHLVLFAAAALVVLGQRLRRTATGEPRRQLGWMTVGLAGGYLPFFGLYVVPHLLHVDGAPLLVSLGVLPLALVPLTFAYAILRYKLWDIEVLVRNTLTLTLTVLIGVFAFSLANVVVNRVIPQDLAATRNLVSFGTGLAIAGVLIPTRRRIGSSLERIQYGTAFRKRRALRELARQVLEERNLDRLCANLIDELKVGLDIDRVNIFLVQEGGLVPVRPQPGLPERLPLEIFGDEVWRDEVESIGEPEVARIVPSPLRALFALGYRYAFPLRVRDSRVGVVIAGSRSGHVPLSSDDTDLIRSLLDQVSLGIENAKLLDQVRHQLDEVVRLQEFSQSIIESSPAGIAVLDTRDGVVACNLAFAALVGRERLRVLGEPLADLLPADDLPRAGEGMRQAVCRDSQGRDRHLQLTRAELRRGDEGSLQVIVVQDVSDRVAMENALKEQERLAALGMLAAGVAHEVNTPITGISSYAQMLLAETPEGDPRRELLEKVERQTFRAARIVNNLLDFARERASEVKPVDLSRVLAECVDLLEGRLAEHRVEVRWSRPAEPVIVTGNEGELQQVFTNLLLNGVDAMAGRGGSLTLGVEESADGALVTVEDEGTGIQPADLERIFQPFYSTKLGRGGTGLGLSICYSIVRHHGGEIRAESEPGRGSRFTVELPRHRQPTARTSA